MIILNSKILNIRKLSLIFLLLLLLSPFIMYIFINIKVSSCGSSIIKDTDPMNTYILQTYKWGKGNYFMSEGLNYVESKDDSSTIDKYKKNDRSIIYIRNLSGKNFEKSLGEHITDLIEVEMLEHNCYTVNSYRIEGNLINTYESIEDIPIYDLQISDWKILKEVQRKGLYAVILPNYYLTILDYKPFSNIFFDLLILLLLSISIYVAFMYMFFNKTNICTKKMVDIILYFVSVAISVMLFIGFAYIYFFFN